MKSLWKTQEWDAFQSKYVILSKGDYTFLRRHRKTKKETGEIPKLNSTTQIAFISIKTSLDNNRQKYEKVVERNKANGKKGGRPKTQNNPNNPSGFFENPKKKIKHFRDRSAAGKNHGIEKSKKKYKYSIEIWNELCYNVNNQLKK